MLPLCPKSSCRSEGYLVKRTLWGYAEDHHPILLVRGGDDTDQIIIVSVLLRLHPLSTSTCTCLCIWPASHTRGKVDKVADDIVTFADQ